MAVCCMRVKWSALLLAAFAFVLGAGITEQHQATSSSVLVAGGRGGEEAVSRSLVRREAGALDGQHRRTASSQPIPSTAAKTPLQDCKSLRSASADPWKGKLREATEALCNNPQTSSLLEVFLDTRFQKQYDRIYTDPDGWAPEAYVNYVKVAAKGSYYGNLTEAMVDSVHRFAKKPVVVINFGAIAPPELDPDRFPNIVLLNGRSVEGISFNFNKLLAVLLAKVKVGVSVDSDMMVSANADQLFRRTAEEITDQFPLPMLPTHYLDRDPANHDKHKGNYLYYHCRTCPTPTMRWGQAHPTWTYWSFPFFGRWLAAKVGGKVEHGVDTRTIGEDEDLLNVALWSENATKTWCMFQMMGAGWIWENYLPQHPPGPAPFYDDPTRFPEGVPVAFYLTHGEHIIDKVYSAMDKLQAAAQQKTDLPALFHKGKFYQNFSALRQDDPGLRCTL